MNPRPSVTKRLKVIMLAPSLADASARLRLTAYEHRLAIRGIDALAAEIPRGAFHRFRVFRALSDYDVVVLHRRLLGAIGFKTIRKNSKKLVFDFDDAVMHRDPFHGPVVSWKRARRFARTVRNSDAIIAGNAYLLEKAVEAGARCRAAVIPTPVEPDLLVSRPPGGSILGWIGQKSTLPYLMDVLPALRAAAASVPGLRLKVISDVFPNDPGIPVDNATWLEATEAAELASVDIGLMPLRDDPWSRGKCGYKILRYFAASRPVIASPVGVNTEMVRHGVSGLLASTLAQWSDSIASLAQDHATQRAMGESGRREIESAGFDVNACASRLADFLFEVASSPVRA